MPNIDVCMIVRDEALVLERCFRSIYDKLAGHVNRIIVVDTGSTDGTFDIACSWADKVVHYDWDDNFAIARNVGLQYADSDWILILDADEEIQAVPPTLKNALAVHEANAFKLAFYDIHDKSWHHDYSPRLFRNGCGFRFVGRIHEQLWPNPERSGKIFHTAIEVIHHGYTPERILEKNKIERNMRIIEKALKECPDDQLLKSYYTLEQLRKNPELINGN